MHAVDRQTAVVVGAVVIETDCVIDIKNVEIGECPTSVGAVAESQEARFKTGGRQVAGALNRDSIGQARRDRDIVHSNGKHGAPIVGGPGSCIITKCPRSQCIRLVPIEHSVGAVLAQ